MDAMTIFYIFVGIILLICLGYWLLKQFNGQSSFDNKSENIKVGMTEEEVVEEFGQPNKIVSISDNIKLYTYTFDKWKGLMFGGTERKELTLTITDGIVTSIS